MVYRYIDVHSRNKAKSGPSLFIAVSAPKSTTKQLPLEHIESGRPELAALLDLGISKVCGPQLLEEEDTYGPQIDYEKEFGRISDYNGSLCGQAFGEYFEEIDG